MSDESVAGLSGSYSSQNLGESPDIEVSEDLWIALQVEGHDDDGETSGIRLRDISAPLAAAGISILFLSTYISDVSVSKLLVTPSALRIRHAFVVQRHSPEHASSQLARYICILTPLFRRFL